MSPRGSGVIAVLFVVLAFVLASQDARAGGFFVRQQSTSAQASAFAGASARGSDPSHLFYNPATISDIPGDNLTIDTRLFLPDADIAAGSATSLLMADVTARGDSGSMADAALAPGLFASSALSDNLTVGIGVSAPFAVIIDTRADWAGEFQLVKTDMTTFNVNPVLAWKALPWVTIAGGIQVQHFKADLRKTEILPLVPAMGIFVETLGFLKGDDTGIGATAGILLEPREGVRIGLGYRSEVKHELKGKAGVKSPLFPNDTATFDVTTPQVASLGVELPVTKAVTLLGEVQWIDWSVFTGFDIAFGSGRPNELRPQDWRDTWFYSGGVRIKAGERTEIMGGVSYDEGISKGPGGNTLSPDGNRLGVSVGLTRKISERTTARLSYMHLFISDSGIDVDNQSGTLQANFSSELDIIGLSVTIRR